MRLLSSTRCALIATAALACALPSAANAASISYDNSGVLTYTADSGEKNYFGVSEGEPGKIAISDSGARGLDYPAGLCSPGWVSYVVECERPTSLSVQTGDLNDIVDGPDDALGLDAAIDGGEGPDVLRADVFGSRPAQLSGGGGDDKLTGGVGPDTLNGGEGSDELNGRDSGDQVLGGGGDDLLIGDGHNVDAAADLIDGGAGFDRIESDWAKNLDSIRPINITLGGGADDGRAGENDDLRSVEKINVAVPGTYIGSENDDWVDIIQREEPSTLRGMGGNDHLEGSDGDEEVDGGAGNDTLEGGYGHDRITGGPGADRIDADVPGGECSYIYCKLPAGNDVVEARDGVVDQIVCGVGQDSVSADANDVVATDCETVQRGGSAPGGNGGDNGNGGNGGGPNGPGASAVQLRFPKTKLRAALSKGVKVQVIAPGAGSVKLQGKRGRTVVASGKGSVPSAGAAKVTLKFTKAARKSLRRARSAKIAVAVTFTGADGSPVKSTSTLTLKR